MLAVSVHVVGVQAFPPAVRPGKQIVKRSFERPRRTGGQLRAAELPRAPCPTNR